MSFFSFCFPYCVGLFRWRRNGCRSTRSHWKRAIRQSWDLARYLRCSIAFRRSCSVIPCSGWPCLNALVLGIRKRRLATSLWPISLRPASSISTVTLSTIFLKQSTWPNKNPNANPPSQIFSRFLILSFHILVNTIQIYLYFLLENVISSVDFIIYFVFVFFPFFFSRFPPSCYRRSIGQADIFSRPSILFRTHGQARAKISTIHSLTSGTWLESLLSNLEKLSIVVYVARVICHDPSSTLHLDTKILYDLLKRNYKYCLDEIGLAEAHSARPSRPHVAATSAYAAGKPGRIAQRTETGDGTISGFS